MRAAPIPRQPAHILPPPDLAQLLRALLRCDLLLDELVPLAAPHEFQHAGTGHASWMGLLRVVRPGGRVRRIDIKIYPAEPACAAFAVNYFANSQVGLEQPARWARVLCHAIWGSPCRAATLCGRPLSVGILSPFPVTT